MKNKAKRLIVIVGPTASGKSDLAIKLAKKYDGEIISADSRQVYRGMDIGSGKVSKKEQKLVPHHLLDVASPKTRFSTGKFVKLAKKSMEDIIARKKIPIIVGGTGFYVDALIYDIPLPEIKPDWKLRKRLEQKTNDQLMAILKKQDLAWANSIDPKNQRRLIRAIEVSKKAYVQKFKITDFYKPKAGLEIIGLAPKQKTLEQNIAKRLRARLQAGMVAEVKRLHQDGVSWKRLESFGLEYKWLSLFLQKKITRAEMLTNLERDILRYAKRQMTWFKRNPNIRWR